MTETLVSRGERTLNPYLHVRNAAILIDFYREAFGAQVGFRGERPDGSIYHAEVTVGNSLIELADTPDARPVMLHYYVETCDSVYDRAVASGGISQRAPVEQPYGDREAGVTDPSGNIWWIATSLDPSQNPAPEGMGSVTMYLNPESASDLIAFMRNAFAAEEVTKSVADNGAVQHALMRIGNSVIELSDAHAPWLPMQATIRVFLADVDGIYNRALSAGATSLTAPTDQSYGERMAGVTDAAGNIWYISKILA
jgi:PhnB protein